MGRFGDERERERKAGGKAVDKGIFHFISLDETNFTESVLCISS